MSHFPLVSVIIPVYNAEKYIEQGYAQIKAQDYPNFEIIFIDNNSSDKTVKLIQDIQANDRRIRLLYEPRQGAGAARNYGIKEAKGDIISFFDIDDEIIPCKISRHVRILENDPEIALVFGRLEKYYPEDQCNYLIPESNFKPGKYTPYSLGIQWLSYFGNIVNPSMVSCRKNAAIAIDGFEEQLLRGEDVAFLIKMAFSFPVYFDDHTIGRYIRHPESTVSTDNKRLKGNPYYIQYKSFYMPYLRDYSARNHDKKPKRLIDQVILGSLNKHIHLLSSNPLERWKLLQKEIQDLKEAGYPARMAIFSYMIGVVPEAFSTILLKAYLKLFPFRFGPH